MAFITSKKTSIKTESYDGYQTVKYHLRARGKSSFVYFRRDDAKSTPVNRTLMRNMKYAHREYERRRKERVAQEAERWKRLNLSRSI